MPTHRSRRTAAHRGTRVGGTWRSGDLSDCPSARAEDRRRRRAPEPLPVEADYDDSSFDADYPGRAQTSGIKRINHDLTHLFVKPVPAQAAALTDLLSKNDFDALIV